MRRGAAVGFAAALIGISCASEAAPDLDRTGVLAADRAYADAWLSNDPEAVMATLSPQAIVVPAGMAAIEGPAAIRNFWFPPDSPPTVIHVYEISQSEVGGSGEMAFVRGTFRLVLDYDGATSSSSGDYLSLLRRGEGGAWRITHRIWNVY